MVKRLAVWGFIDIGIIGTIIGTGTMYIGYTGGGQFIGILWSGYFKEVCEGTTGILLISSSPWAKLQSSPFLQYPFS